MSKIIESINIQGSIYTGDDVSKYALDFGKTITKKPLAVANTTSAEDIIKIIAVAKKHSVPLSIRGAGHSCYGQTLCNGGIVINNISSKPQFKVHSESVEVNTRTRWLDLENALNAMGRSLPVLTDYLTFSVGGTLSVGGYGVRSVTEGSQVDQVQKLQIITWNGDILWCSPDENEEIFRYALCGMGQLGIIEKVIMRTTPYFPKPILHHYRHPSLEHLVATFESFLDENNSFPDYFEAAMVGENFLNFSHPIVNRILKTGTHLLLGKKIIGSRYGFHNKERINFEKSELLRNIKPKISTIKDNYALFSHRKQDKYVSSLHRQKRIWTDYMLNYEGLCKFTSFMEEELQDKKLANYLGVLYFLGNRKPKKKIHFAFEPASGIKDRMTFLVGVFYAVPENDTTGVNYVREALKRSLQKVVSLGGRPYLYGWNDLDNKMRNSLYGDSCEKMINLCQELDPEGVGKLLPSFTGETNAV
ncbi:FAD-binding protein [Candidatus Uabimicrobium sp. HlEnr_7]|uniref:FAD-binding protein n=1 Tax=Candidatus Uabimicrobium helgolandensis TaxID=3095367 RepID=UPI00355683EF